MELPALDAETEQRLAKLALTSGKSKEWLVREIIERGLENMEEHYRIQATIERIRKGEEAVYSSAQVRRELGLDD